MIDLGFAALLALISAGFGKRILDGLGCSPEHPLDAMALALPLGMGLTALATLALGELGCLNFVGLSVLLAVLVELGIIAWFNLFREMRAWFKTRVQTRSRTSLSLFFAVCLGLVLLGTALTALTPVTDGDALCYHLQVPKVFLMRGSVGFVPDLHETVYPLVTEMLYAMALEFRGPVACRGIQWVLGLVFAANVTALARPEPGPPRLVGRRDRALGAGRVQRHVGAAQRRRPGRVRHGGHLRLGPAPRTAEREGRDPGRAARRPGDRREIPGPGLVRFAGPGHRAASGRSGRCRRQADARPRWLALAGLYLVTALAAGGWWYLRAYVHTGNPVYPFFRDVFGGAGLAEVLDPIKRPLPVTPFNLLSALVPLSLQPDRFDSFSHQFGPVFLLFLPAVFLYRAPRRVLILVGLAYAFLVICMTQRQSMRFLLIALGPMSIGVAYVASIWCNRRTVPARLLIACLGRGHGSGGEPGGRPVAARARRLARPRVGRRVPRPARADIHRRAVGRSSPARGRPVDRSGSPGILHSARLHDGASPSAADGPGCVRVNHANEIVARLCESGFTHVMFCPPVPETAVEFDPTLGRLLAPWTARQTALFREDLTDGDGVLRQYSIYELIPRESASLASAAVRSAFIVGQAEGPEAMSRVAADGRRAQSSRPERPASRDRQLAGATGCPADGGLRLLAGDPAGPECPPGDSGRALLVARRPRWRSARGIASSSSSASCWPTWASGSTTSTARSPAGVERSAWTAFISIT